MKNNDVINCYRQLKKCPFEITKELVSSVIRRPPNHALGIYGFMYDFDNYRVKECNYDVAYNASSKEIKNNLITQHDVEGDGVFDINIHNATFAYLKIDNVKIPFEKIDDTYKLPPLTVNTPLLCDMYEIHTDGDIFDYKVLWFNSMASTKMRECIENADINKLMTYYLRTLSNRELSKTKI